MKAMLMVLLVLSFGLRAQSADTTKVIMLCIDTTTHKRFILYPAESHTLAGTPLMPDVSDQKIEEKYYNKEPYWQFGYKTTHRYLMVNGGPMPKGIIVLINYIIK